MTSSMKEVYKIFTLINTEKEAEKVLQDLLTPQEIETLAERWEVVSHLLDGNLTQREIQEKTGAAIATVSRANRMIKYGSGGFQWLYEKIHSL